MKKREEASVGAKTRDRGKCSFCFKRLIQGVMTTPPALTLTLSPACVRLPKFVLSATKPETKCSSVASAATPREKWSVGVALNLAEADAPRVTELRCALQANMRR